MALRVALLCFFTANVAASNSSGASNLAFGRAECPCLPFSELPGSHPRYENSSCLVFSGGYGLDAEGSVACYPKLYGGACSAWDMDMPPECVNSTANNNEVPSWCGWEWCFVDGDACKRSDVPYIAS